jgi:hypothetical protein
MRNALEICGLALCAVLAAPGVARPAPDGASLPQLRQVIKLSNDAATAGREYFAQPGAEEDIPDPFKSFLVNALPDSLHDACGALVATWGDQTGGTETWRVLVLEAQDKNVWLAFHCTSTVQSSIDYFDERLGLLRVDAGTLELVPLGPDSRDSILLYHLQLSDQIALGVGNSLVLQVISSNDNPCCPNVDSSSEEKLVVLADSPQGVVTSLSVVTEGDHHARSEDPPLDTETVYHGKLEFEHDAKGRVKGAKCEFTEETLATKPGEAAPSSPPAKRTSGVLQFRWNAQKFKFDEE